MSISASIPVPAESASPTSVILSNASVPGGHTIPPPYAPPPMLAGPSAFAIDGSMEELVDGRIPRNGNIEIRFCKPAAAGAGPSNVLITSPQSLVVPFHMMRVMVPKETVGVNASRMAVMEEDRMEETVEMGMEMEVGTMARHLLPRPQ